MPDENDAPVTAEELDLWERQPVYAKSEDAVPRLIRALREAQAEILRDGQNWQLVADLKNARIAALEADKRRLVEELDQYRWRPISEIHEDLGPCVLIRLDDPGYMEIGSNLDEDFNEPGWTHFAEVPKLTHKEAEQLRLAAIDSAGKAE